MTILALCVILSACEARFEVKSHPILPVGTKVQHKSGGPEMVVIEAANGSIRCRWLDNNGDSHSEWFYELEFEKR